MSEQQLPGENNSKIAQLSISEIQEQFNHNDKGNNNFALTQSIFRDLFSLKPGKQHKKMDQNQQLQQNGDFTQQKHMQKEVLFKQSKQSKDLKEQQQNEQINQEDLEQKKEMQDQNTYYNLKIDSFKLISLEFAQIISDFAQFVELKTTNSFKNSSEIYILGFQIVYALLFQISILIWLRYIKNKKYSEQKIISFYNQHFLKSFLNKYNMLVLSFIIILNIVRLETFLMRLDERLPMFVITFLVNQLVLLQLNRVISKIFTACFNTYFFIRYMIDYHNFIFIYINSILAIFAISCVFFNQIKYQASIKQLKVKKQVVSEYFKQFYHNIVSMMPQGILIIDEQEQLVYANKTTKKILSCKNKNQIIDSLKNLIIQDPSKLQADTTQHDDQRTLKDFKTFKSFKSLKSRKPLNIQYSMKQDSNSYNQGPASESESFVSQYFIDGFYPSPVNVNHLKQIIQPVKEKQNQFNILNMYCNNAQQQQNSGSSKNQNRNSLSSQQKQQLQQQQYSFTPATFAQTAQTEKQTPSTQFQLLQSIQKGSNQSIFNDQNLVSGGLISKITTSVEGPSSQFIQNQRQTFQNNQVTNKHFQGQDYKNQNSNNEFNQISDKDNQIKSNKENDPKETTTQKPQKDHPFRYIQQSIQQNQKKFENLSVMEVISVLLKDCVMKLKMQDFSDMQQSFQQNQQAQNQINQNFKEHKHEELPNQDIPQNIINNNLQQSQKSSAQRNQKEQINNIFSLQSSQKNQDSGGTIPKLHKQSIDLFQNSLYNNPSTFRQNISSQYNTSLKNNTEIAQNSLSVRVQVKERLIEITFIQCEAKLFQIQKASQQNNQNMNQSVQKSVQSEKETSHQLNTNYPNSTAIILVFLEDITQEVYIKRLEELNNYKIKMLSSISHELKTPLNCCMGMLDDVLNLISNENFGDLEISQKIRESLEPAQQSNQLLLYMIRDLIDLGTFELVDNFKFEFSKFNLKMVLQSCVDIIKYQSQLKFIEINLIYDQNLDEMILSDENRVRSIVVNFLTNSLKFTQRNGKITVKAELTGNNNAKISVEDNGIGIPQKKLSEIFKFYNKSDMFISKNQITQGIGIGLSVSYKLAQGLTIEEYKNQPIQVKSEEKKGSIFCFVLKNQDIQLIDNCNRESEIFDDYQNKQGQSYYRKGETESLSRFEDQDRSQTFTNTKYTQKYQQDIPEDFDQENDEDDDNGDEQEGQIKELGAGILTSKSNAYQYSGKKQKNKTTQQSFYQSENVYDEDDYINSEIYLKLQKKPQTPLFSKYFQNDLVNMLQDIESQKHEDILYSQKMLENYPSFTNNHADITKEISTQNLSKNQINITLSKLPSLQHLMAEETSILKNMGSQQNGLQPQHNNQILNLQPPPSPLLSNQVSMVNIDQQLTIDEFIKYNTSQKDLFFSSEFGQILIVDDIQFNLLMLSNLLKRYQMKVDLAHDGQEAVNKVQEKYQKQKETYQIIFMDIQMPIMDGFQATKEIRKFLQQKNASQIPIIAVSAFGDQQFKEQSKKVGMTDYIEKPVQTIKLDKAFLKHVLK
ncbi:response regulator receiver domain protein (macronuclear) [Tetrahymena thermophila SB210]|uniref:Response regulator receiver domain protein n=1 Tax=Tetrahymena thermophila (strain SB210) TaxID=312017 RepID=I7MA30_TETTS|nr:response regulator receiver domain protein [Tetrahymena thermophila SB210]EAS03288.2 response regulator receiver domain protein [Tetrahymena thermophila SB210]|eukprot:XP_001023533.2 response regulator receiver domain protein [Tetrahymena thermophila SB210]